MEILWANPAKHPLSKSSRENPNRPKNENGKNKERKADLVTIGAMRNSLKEQKWVSFLPILEH